MAVIRKLEIAPSMTIKVNSIDSVSSFSEKSLELTLEELMEKDVVIAGVTVKDKYLKKYVVSVTAQEATDIVTHLNNGNTVTLSGALTQYSNTVVKVIKTSVTLD